MTEHRNLLELLLGGWTDFTCNGIHVVRLRGESEVHIRLIAPINHDQAENLRNIGYDLATEYLSETTNNDACDVTVRERSAHLDFHADLSELYDSRNPLGPIVVDVIVEDSLS
jgi:hypothetical protein